MLKKNILYLIIAFVALLFSLFKIDHQVFLAAWIAPVFLLRFSRNSKWILGSLLMYFVMEAAHMIGLLPFIISSGSFSPSINVNDMMIDNIISSLVVPIYLLPYFIDKGFRKKLPPEMQHFIFPLVLVSVEFAVNQARGMLTSYGISQFDSGAITMISSLIGTYGISFLIGWTASMTNALWEKNWNIIDLKKSMIIFGVVFIAAISYGSFLVAFPKITDKSVFTAGITLDTQWDQRVFSALPMIKNPENRVEQYANVISSPESHWNEVKNKTRDAAEKGAELIVWQEFALTLTEEKAQEVLAVMKELALEKEIYILLSYAEIDNEKKVKGILRNLGVLITPEGEIGWEYEKAHPIPGENILVQPSSNPVAYYDTPFGRIGQVICYDMHYDELMRQVSESKIDILISPSYDGVDWTPLHTMVAGIRAVEQGVTVIRITGDGQSAVIDPWFREWGNFNSFIHGYDNFYCQVPVISRGTVYSTVGFVFPYLIVITLLGILIYGLIIKRRTSHSG